jgi:hypothetical protein
VTYADDLVILCKNGKADEALQQLRKIMSGLRLTVPVGNSILLTLISNWAMLLSYARAFVV